MGNTIHKNFDSNLYPKYVSKSITETFENYPKAPNAYTTGQFNTLQRECGDGLKKCTKCVNGCNGMTYWCAPNCDNTELNIHGQELKEPLPWNVRYA